MLPLPDGVSLGTADPQADHPAVGEEAVFLAGAVETRQREFRAGRAAARAALAQLGAPAVAIPRNPDRTPAWPAGYVGSISHTRTWAGAVVASRSRYSALGLDAETRRRVRQHLHKTIATPAEREWMAAVDGGEETATVIFSAKEAIYKCLYPRRLSFADASLTIDRDTGSITATVQADAQLSGRFWQDDAHVFTLFTIGA